MFTFFFSPASLLALLSLQPLPFSRHLHPYTVLSYFASSYVNTLLSFSYKLHFLLSLLWLVSYLLLLLLLQLLLLLLLLLSIIRWC